jgi:hypothetical protein
MVPKDPVAIKYFFEGLPQGESVPWGVCAIPLACWGLFFVALYLVMISVAVIKRTRKHPLNHSPILFTPSIYTNTPLCYLSIIAHLPSISFQFL